MPSGQRKQRCEVRNLASDVLLGTETDGNSASSWSELGQLSGCPSHGLASLLGETGSSSHSQEEGSCQRSTKAPCLSAACRDPQSTAHRIQPWETLRLSQDGTGFRTRPCSQIWAPSLALRL